MLVMICCTLWLFVTILLGGFIGCVLFGSPFLGAIFGFFIGALIADVVTPVTYE